MFEGLDLGALQTTALSRTAQVGAHRLAHRLEYKTSQVLFRTCKQNQRNQLQSQLIKLHVFRIKKASLLMMPRLALSESHSVRHPFLFTLPISCCAFA
jgi:hypothetical protein